ncbi:L-seryl-tRNA(Sec) selenium transferase [Actinomadura darangshiensis]|uniref:L-seryl-tRNA(Sec) selenium transferase n=1 Tax=Actinomadura darangshiensis TaxID=705336 RepID=A0A4R5C298_9ACTN|nr:L-seryl-tRNA(Sec) selenium transferase [Actinomadura darangshiensis]TDD92935.1 L-seryl-tRNA(Sec) selenium transferase [Actinomadura darangshiensis]
MSDPRRLVPGTDTVLADNRFVEPLHRLGQTLVKRAVREAQEQARLGEIPPGSVTEMALALLPDTASTLRPVLNATGIVLHTNLGRAPLSPAAVEALCAAAGYVDVEYDVLSGARARRGRGTLDALRESVPAAEDVHIVNNGAAALALVVATLAAGREVVISRGEMVEIGDRFRIPDLLISAGARLREVGTTNRTQLADYAEAVGANTGFIVKIHPSNFRVDGFTQSVGVRELSTLGPPVVADVGSGLLRPDPLLAEEPDVTTWLCEGAALVTSSGDKLLGGPQAGLIFGRRAVIQTLRRNPLARAFRVDKLTLAALEATLRGPEDPVRRSLTVAPKELRRRAEVIAADLRAEGVTAVAVESSGAVGGGGAPGVDLPGWAVGLPASFSLLLRQGHPCIVGRVEAGRCLLDLRCLSESDDIVLHRAVVAAAACLATS